MREQVAIRCVLMRGGTSKGVFLSEADLPAERAARDRAILALFGSPDPRQIDGLGGADILTSKVAIIGPPTRPDADVDYTFGQVSIREPVVDYDINCGNLSAAVGVYAIEEGFIRASEPVTSVRVHNTNTAKVFVAHVPVRDGAPAVEGDTVIDGVPGSGAEIVLDFTGTVGAVTGRLLPTGQPLDRLNVPALGGSVEASIVDVANLCVFVAAADVGMTGAEGPADFTAAHLRALIAVKDAAAAHLRVSADGLVPLPIAVAPPAAYHTFAGRDVSADDVDLLARLAGGRPPMLHKTFPGTAATCTAVAARIAGTVTAAASARARHSREIRIGHPGGVMPARAWVSDGPPWTVREAGYFRTARRLLEGHALVRRAVLDAYAGARR
ncbi:MAG TPA: PrpF domain-containing protein [bacterium]|nr:PrpF domain-containing protein [bacterium]